MQRNGEFVGIIPVPNYNNSNILDVLDPVIRRNKLFMNNLNVQKFSKGEVILSERDPIGRVYFILAGKVKIVNYSSQGKEIWHGELGPSQSFGELAVLSGQARIATIAALEQTTTASISNSHFEQILESDSNVSLWLLRDISNRLIKSTETVYAHVGQRISERVCRELIGLADQSLLLPTILPKPNVTEIAKRINSDRESVSRAISSLVRRGVIKRASDRYEILDWDLLTNESEV